MNHNLDKKKAQVIGFSLIAIVSFAMFMIGLFLPSRKFCGLFSSKPVPVDESLLVRMFFCGMSMVAFVICCIRVYMNTSYSPKKRQYMKMITAILSGLFTFVFVGFMIGILLLWIWPYSSTVITIGNIQANIASIIGFVVGSIAGRHSFKASLHSKTGRLYKEKNNEVRN